MSAKRPKTGGRNRRKCRVRTAFLPQLREKKEKIRPKIKKHCQKQAKGDMIDKNSKRKRVGFALQFIPARGRKRPKLFVKLNSFAKIAIYPREGTETSALPRLREERPLQFIPARGRKHVIRARENIGFTLQFIPARGRKLPWLPFCPFLPYCNLSPRGDGNFHVSITFSS